MDRLWRRHRRYIGDDRPLPALSRPAHAAVRRRADRPRLRAGLAQRAIPTPRATRADRHRGHRPPARRARLPVRSWTTSSRCRTTNFDRGDAWELERLLGRRYGGSSGTNLVACLQLAARMHARGQRGSIVSLLCDRGERYDGTLFNPDWLRSRQLDIAPWSAALEATLADAVVRRRRPDKDVCRTVTQLRSANPGHRTTWITLQCQTHRRDRRHVGRVYWIACAPRISSARIGCSAASAFGASLQCDTTKPTSRSMSPASTTACCGPMWPCW